MDTFAVDRQGMAYKERNMCFLASRIGIIDQEARASLDLQKEHCGMNEYQHITVIRLQWVFFPPTFFVLFRIHLFFIVASVLTIFHPPCPPIPYPLLPFLHIPLLTTSHSPA